MKLSVNTPEANWEEAARFAREYNAQCQLEDTSKEEPKQVIGKFKYNLWKTKTMVNVTLAD